MTTPSAKADGFLGHARTVVPRYVPNAQSERSVKDITGCVDISVNHQPTMRTEMNTVRESFRNIRQAPASGAYLRSPVGVDPSKSPTSVFYFVGELGKERTPSRIADRLCQHTFRQCLDVQILNGNKPVSVSKLTAQFVMKVSPLVSDMSVSFLEKPDCFPAIATALPSSSNFPLASSKGSKPCFKIPRIINPLPIGKGNKGIKPHIHANSIRRGHKATAIYNYAKAGIPLPCLSFQGECLNLASDRAVHLEFYDTNALHLEPAPICKVATIPPSGEGITIKPVFGLEAGIASFFSSLHSTEESLESLVYPPENILASREVGKPKVSRISYLFKLASLVKVVKANPLHLPSVSTLLHRSIVERTSLRQLVCKGIHLLFVRIKAVFEGSTLHLFTVLIAKFQILFSHFINQCPIFWDKRVSLGGVMALQISNKKVGMWCFHNQVGTKCLNYMFNIVKATPIKKVDWAMFILALPYFASHLRLNCLQQKIINISDTKFCTYKPTVGGFTECAP